MAADLTNAKKPPNAGRKRRVLGWTLLVMGLLIAADWAASARWSFSHFATEWSITTWRGCLTFVVPGSKAMGGEPGWFISRANEPLVWFLTTPSGPGMPAPDREINIWIARYSKYGVFEILDIVLWLPALAALVAGGVLLRSGTLARRRAMAGHCRRCGYDLSGLAAGTGAPCPECGAATRPR